MNYHIILVTDLEQNCTLLWCDHTDETIVVDPGGDIGLITQQITELKLHPVEILLTHGHFDHVGGAKELSQLLSIPITGPHMGDLFWFQGLSMQSRMFGLGYTIQNFIPDRWLNHGDTINFGDEVLEVLHCPGHTPGHVAYFNRSDQLAIVGDVLFQNGIGRTDFPGGNYDMLMHSIKKYLLPLGDKVRFIPGHGPMSSFGEERQNNPFLQ
jgi:glyoxylase-like metal-dependent hydrolase (beta-lactamase superfamily II)